MQLKFSTTFLSHPNVVRAGSLFRHVPSWVCFFVIENGEMEVRIQNDERDKGQDGCVFFYP